LPVKFPPLNEQRRIVAKIEALNEKSSKAKQALDAVPRLLEKLRQSILAAAFRGDLTKDWRAKNKNVEPASKLLERIRIERRKKWEEAELAKMKAKGKTPTDDKWTAKYKEPEPVDTTGLPELPEGWCWASLGDFLSWIEAGKSFACDERPPSRDEVGVVKVSAVTWGEFDEEESKTCTRADLINESLLIKAGDFLFSRANTIELVGAPVIVKHVTKKLMLSDKILRFHLIHENGELLKAVLQSPWGRSEIERLATGNQDGMRNIGQERIREIRIPVAPLDEQAPLLATLGSALQPATGLVDLVAEHRKLLSVMDSSILSKAFRGELVPQDPNDEPASVLLERIGGEREAEQSAPKGKMARGRRKAAE
jgi:type I restriction enzyme S subunit